MSAVLVTELRKQFLDGLFDMSDAEVLAMSEGTAYRALTELRLAFRTIFAPIRDAL